MWCLWNGTGRLLGKQMPQSKFVVKVGRPLDSGGHVTIEFGAAVPPQRDVSWKALAAIAVVTLCSSTVVAATVLGVITGDYAGLQTLVGTSTELLTAMTKHLLGGK
jgi:hypothetical protein